MIAFMPEPHTLLTVVQPVETGRPAPSEAWRAGACPRLAGNTQPMKTSDTSAGAIPDCCNAARMAVAPSVVVGTPVNWPRKEPIAVRLAPTITTESDMRSSGYRGITRLCAGCCAAANTGQHLAFQRDSERAVVQLCGHGALRHGWRLWLLVGSIRKQSACVEDHKAAIKDGN